MSGFDRSKPDASDRITLDRIKSLRVRSDSEGVI